MIETSKDWLLADQGMSDDFKTLMQKLKLDRQTSELLWNRNIRQEAEINGFLNPSLDNLHDPYLLNDMDKAVKRILAAIELGQTILIYGDYDADGMTATSLLKSALDELGAEVITYLPNRFTDGYGPNVDVYDYYIEQEGVDLIITVDNGVAGHEAIKLARDKEVDVIVTDHHSMPKDLPDAYAIIHPKHPDSIYPFSDLAGVGVAFKLACALLEYIPTELLDLVAIGTIADMVSLTDENRIMVKYGLSILANTERVGLGQLMTLSGLDISDSGALTEEAIGFQIAPRLNALGRLDDPNPAIELLTSWDEEETQTIAELIDQKNTERKKISESILNEALAMVNEDPVQILYKKDWHPGVLGIVAGRLVEKLKKPVILLSETDGILKGSARSVSNYNIFEALDNHRDLFINFGGHAQAAGMTFELDQLEAIRKVLIDYVSDKNIDMSEREEVLVDGILKLSEINMDLLDSIEKLAPYGMGNPKPQFIISDYNVSQTRIIGSDSSHLKMKFEGDKTAIDALYFSHATDELAFKQLDTEVLVNLGLNSWNGKTNVQLLILDARVNGVQLYDLRGKDYQIAEDVYVFDTNWENNDIISDALLVDTIPEDLSSLEKLLAKHDFKAVYFKNRLENDFYLTGAGSREQFSRLYKTLKQYPEFDVRYKLQGLADYLKIPLNLLVQMIKIFEELGFVTIDDGLMKVKPNAPKRNISESQIYQNLQEEVKRQEFLALAPVRDIYNKLKEEK